MQHDLGWVYMWENYPVLREALEKKGWTVDDQFGLWKLVRK